jgi:flagellar protein FliO/FliZ
MFDLFGAEMPLAVRFFLAFLIVLGLIGAAAWAVRRFGSARLGGAVRGRQPRLAVIEYATVDARRRLLLVRRDNVEHLMMIGGPSDVVVESNIVRAVPALREPAVPRAPGPADTLSRAIPLPEIGSNGSWPLQPEPPAPPAPPAPPRRAPRIEQIPEEQMSAPPPYPEPPPRPQREVLSALADDLAAHPPPVAPVAPITPLPPRNRPPAPPRLAPAEARTEHRPELRMPAPQPAVEPAAVDQSLAEMAQRLEAALRKPKAVDTRAQVAPESQDEADDVAASAPPPPPSRPVRPAEAKPVRAEANVKDGVKEGKALYDTLEQEMASLLGRPASKN